MIKKQGYVAGVFLGILIFSFGSQSLLGGYLSYQGQLFMDYFIPFFSAVSIIIGIAVGLRKIRIRTIELRLIISASGTVAILHWIIAPIFLS